jgi:hypothetical protein
MRVKSIVVLPFARWLAGYCGLIEPRIFPLTWNIHRIDDEATDGHCWGDHGRLCMGVTFALKIDHGHQARTTIPLADLDPAVLRMITPEREDCA